MLNLLDGLSSRHSEDGFTLVELLVVTLILGILAAAAVPLYLGYVKDAKTAEAKIVAGSVWTSVLNNAMTACGKPSPVSDGFPKAGLSSTGASTPPRWSVPSGAGTLTVDCITGALTVSESPLFKVAGTGSDVSFVVVQFMYSAAASPPSRLQCSTDSGTSFVDC